MVHTEEESKALFVPYISGEKKSCATKTEIGSGDWSSREKCENRCKVNDNCKFFFYANARWCFIYSACNEHRKTVYIGDTLKKNVAELGDVWRFKKMLN